MQNDEQEKLADYSGLLDSSPINRVGPMTPVQTVAEGSVSGALWRRENMIGSWYESSKLQSRLSEFQNKDDTYDFVAATPDDLVDFADRFIGLDNYEQASIKAEFIREEIADKQNMSMHPWQSFFKGFVIGNLDPSVLLPGSTIYKTIKGAGGVARGAMAAASAAAISTTFQEAYLSSSQQTRELDESIFNVAASAIFGGAIGGLTGKFAGGPIGRKARKDIVDTYAKDTFERKAMGADMSDLDREYLKASEEYANLGSLVGKTMGAASFNPFARLGQSSFVNARKIVDHLYDHNILKNKHTEEFGSNAAPINVDIEIKKRMGKAGRTQLDYQDIFFEQAGVKQGLFKMERSALSKQGLNFETFNEQVSDALRNNNNHANPYVARAAELFEKKIFTPMKEKAIELKLLPKNVDVKTALSYLTKVYDTDKIKLNKQGFINDVLPWMREKNAERTALEPQIQSFNKRIKAADRIEKSAKKLENAKNKRLKIDKSIKNKNITPTELKKLNAQRLVNSEEIKKLEANIQKDALITRGKSAKELEADLDNLVPFDLKDPDGKIRPISEDDFLVLAAEQTYDNVVGRNAEKLLNPNLSKFVKGKVKPLNSRVFMIPDERIKQWLVNDASKLADMYTKAMVPTIEMHAFAQRFSDPKVRGRSLELALAERADLITQKRTASQAELPSIEQKLTEVNEKIESLERPPTPDEVMGEIMLEIKEELEELKIGKSEKEIIALEKEFDKTKTDIETTFELLEGRYGRGFNTLGDTWNTVAKNLKTWQVVRLLGGMVISSLADVSYHVMRHGPGAFAKEGIRGMVAIMADKNSPLRNNLDMLRDMNRCLETLNANRISALMGHEGAIQNTGLFTKGLDYVASKFGNATLINHWQDSMQFLAGNMSISRTLRDIDAWATSGVMSKAGKERLNALGIGQEHWRAIHEEWKKTGGIDDGSYWANYGDWDLSSPSTARAYEAFKSGVLREVDSTAILPGLADKPLLAYGDIGSNIFLFKNFLAASTNRILAAGLSRNDANFYAGLVGSLMMGAVVYVTKSIIRDPEAEVDLSWNKVLGEAIDWSGAAGILLEPIQIAGKATGLLGSSRYQSRGFTGALLGPTGGAIDDSVYLMNKIIRSMTDEDVTVTQRDMVKLSRLFPYQNLFYLHTLNRKLVKSAAESIGLEE